MKGALIESMFGGTTVTPDTGVPDAEACLLPERLRQLLFEIEFAGKITTRDLAGRIARPCPEVLLSLQYMERIGQVLQLNGYWMPVVSIILSDEEPEPRGRTRRKRRCGSA